MIKLNITLEQRTKLLELGKNTNKLNYENIRKSLMSTTSIRNTEKWLTDDKHGREHRK
jgi:hypothetical protein